jgi:lycopene beta-cyclase
MPSTSPDRCVDVVIIGDGPAGCALATSCGRRGVDVLLVGPDEPWEHTYGTWIDDLDDAEAFAAGDTATLFSSVLASMSVHTTGARDLDRAYGVFDNLALRARLRDGIEHLTATATDVRTRTGGHHVVDLSDGTRLQARVVIDTTGWPSSFARRPSGSAPAWQTAMGVVLDSPPTGDLGRATWMDFRAVSGGGAGDRVSTIGPIGVSTFCYALPVHDGWLVEETVLAARPAVEPIALLPRLAARLGRHPDDLLADAVRTEYVRIPMGGPRPVADQPVVAFGAAAGYVHPATGFSIASSMRASARVADAIADALAEGPASGAVDAAPIAEAVWPSSSRRTRQLHEYGLHTLLRLDDDGVRQFFGAFFDLPTEEWRRYLHIDAEPTDVARVMTDLFRSSSWSMRRRLMAGNPLPLVRLLRP